MYSSTLGSVIMQSIFQTWGALIALLSLLLAVLGWLLVPADSSIDLRLFVAIMSLASFVVTTLARAIWIVFNEIKVSRPRVRFVKSPPQAYSESFALLLLDPIKTLAYDAVASIYYLENEIEKLVGLGKVINIQEDGKVQLLVVVDYDFSDKLPKLCSNSSDELEKIIIKNTIPWKFFGEGSQ